MRGSPSEFCTQPGPFGAFPHCQGSGNQPECWEKPILCELHRIWDKIQLCSGKDHILAIHKTHKKPNHKYLHPCLLEPKPLAGARGSPGPDLCEDRGCHSHLAPTPSRSRKQSHHTQDDQAATLNTDNSRNEPWEMQSHKSASYTPHRKYRL